MILVFHNAVERYNKCVEKLVEKYYICGKLMSHLNVSKSCDLTEHNIRTALLSTPRSQNPHNPRS